MQFRKEPPDSKAIRRLWSFKEFLMDGKGVCGQGLNHNVGDDGQGGESIGIGHFDRKGAGAF